MKTSARGNGSAVNRGDENRSREKIELGIRGENLAADYLQDLGYEILKRNERVGHSDIDILAVDGETLVFTEVRTKTSGERGMPEETLTGKKLFQMRKTAERYLSFRKHEGPARLDAVCILLDADGRTSHFKHYRGVG